MCQVAGNKEVSVLASDKQKLLAPESKNRQKSLREDGKLQTSEGLYPKSR